MKKLYFEDFYKLLEEEYMPYDFLYKGETLKLKEIQERASNYSIRHMIESGNKLIENLANSNYYQLFGNEVAYEYLVKLYYNKERLYESLKNENLNLNPNGRYVELSLNSIHLLDEGEDEDITEYNDETMHFLIDNWDPIIVDYPMLIDDLNKNHIEHTFRPIEEMKEIVKEEGFVNPNPIVKKKIKRLYH